MVLSGTFFGDVLCWNVPYANLDNTSSSSEKLPAQDGCLSLSETAPVLLRFQAHGGLVTDIACAQTMVYICVNIIIFVSNTNRLCALSLRKLMVSQSHR